MVVCFTPAETNTTDLYYVTDNGRRRGDGIQKGLNQLGLHRIRGVTSEQVIRLHLSSEERLAGLSMSCTQCC